MTPTLDREWVLGAVAWTRDDQHSANDKLYPSTAAEWPWIMPAQRLAWHHGIDGALTRLLRPSTAREAAGRKAPAVAG